jgi:hypothetical protein
LKFLFTIWFSIAGLCSLAQQAEQKLAAAIRGFHLALVNKDTVAIRAQTDPALSYGHSNGWVETKADMIRDLQTGYLVYNRFSEDSLVLSVNGKMASARFIADITASLKGNNMTLHLKVLEVWRKKKGHWVLFARQAVKA